MWELRAHFVSTQTAFFFLDLVTRFQISLPTRTNLARLFLMGQGAAVLALPPIYSTSGSLPAGGSGP